MQSSNNVSSFITILGADCGHTLRNTAWQHWPRHIIIIMTMPDIFSMLYKAGAKRYHALMGIPTYNITAAHTPAYTWFQVPKNGTRTLLSVLREKTRPYADGHYLPYYPAHHREHFKFSFVRNPWSRLVSCYKDKILGQLLFPGCWGRDFEFFIDFVAHQDLRCCDPHLRLQVSLFPLKDMDHIARFENFSEEFHFIINERLQLDSPLPHLNKAKHARERHYTEYYNERTRKIIAKCYAEDIALMGYRYGD